MPAPERNVEKNLCEPDRERLKVVAREVAAAQFHSGMAGPIILRNTPPPFASNDLLGVVSINARQNDKQLTRYFVKLRNIVSAVCPHSASRCAQSIT